MKKKFFRPRFTRNFHFQKKFDSLRYRSFSGFSRFGQACVLEGRKFVSSFVKTEKMVRGA